MKRTNALAGALILATGLMAWSAPVVAQPSVLDPTATQVSTGSGHACALTTDGGVKCWGYNGSGGLGDGTTTTRSVPVDVLGLTSGVVSISAGDLHTCALTTAGGVKCWGYNASGQLGDGTTTNRPTAVDVVGLTSGVASIAAGSSHTCALTVSGGVKCWGYNGVGWLGDGTTDIRLTAVDVVGLGGGAARLTVGASHACVVTRAGAVKCWGTNNDGQLGDATTTDRLTPTATWGLSSRVADVSAGSTHTCAVLSDGGAKCWGNNSLGQIGDGGQTIPRTFPTTVVGVPSGVARISAGADRTCALTTEGGVMCWGSNSRGALGNGATADSPTPVDVLGLTAGVAAVSAGGLHACALTAFGSVKCWGRNSEGEVGNGVLSTSQPTASAVAGLSGAVTRVAAAQTHTCAVTEGGRVSCWGRNDFGQIGDGTATTRLAPTLVTGLGRVVRVATGNYHTCVVTSTGGVKCWGYNANGQVGDGTPFMRFTPVDVTGLGSGVADVVAGAVHSCALTIAGGVKCWGENGEGWLGNGATTGGRTPVDVTGLSSGVVSISARGAHTCALTTAGGVKCWGANNAGQLGDGSTTTRSTPVDVLGLNSGVAAIAAGGEHSCALLASGGIRCWGNNGVGELGDGSNPGIQPTPVDVVGVASMTRVAAGDFHTCATTALGALKCWGYNGSGGLGNGALLSSAVPVDVLGLSVGVTGLALGNGHSCALWEYDGLSCWGSNEYGTLGDGTTADRLTAQQIKAGQTIAFTPPPSLPMGVPTSLAAAASSGLAVAFDTWTPDTCSIDGDTVTATSTALCSIRASQSGNGNYAPAPQQLSLVVVPVGTVPDAPTIGIATAGDASVGVTFLPPANDGGSEIGSYTATCGSASASRSESPIAVTGLANGVPVTCTVVATNWSGDSAPSAVSNSAIPTQGANVSLTLNLDGLDGGAGGVDVGLSTCNNGFGGPKTCAFSYPPGTALRLTARASANSGFQGWTGACAYRGAEPNCDVIMTENVTVGAIYQGPKTLTIQLVSFENGVGQAFANSQEGLNLQCDGAAGTTVTCTGQVRLGDTVYFSAFPGTLSVLDSIAGCTADPFDPNGAGCYPGFVMTGHKTLVATFRGPQTLTVQATSLENGAGHVFANSTGGTDVQCVGASGTTVTCTAQVRVGATVYFSAFPWELSVLDSIAGCTADPFDPNGAGCYPGFLMTGPKTVSATFRGPQTLTVQAVSLENGVGQAYASSTGGMNLQCEGASGTTVTCTAQVRVGDTVYFSAFPGNLSVLSSIAGCTANPFDLNGAGCYPGVAMTGPKTVSATFRGPQTLTVQAVSLENGVGQLFANSPEGMNLQCEGAPGTTVMCTTQVRIGDTVYFSAFPGNLSVLNSIAGCTADPFSPDGAGCYPGFGMTGPKTVSATFRGPQVLTVGFSGAGSGQVGLPPSGVCGSSQGTCAFPLRVGSLQELLAMPSTDSLFDSWTGACTGQGATCSIAITDDMVTHAVFVPRNRAPIAVAGGPYSGLRNQAVPFNGAASSDLDNDPLTYTWDFGDGSAAGSGAAPTHAYATTGTFTITLTVNDGTVNSTPTTAAVTISNQAPTANAGGPYTGSRNTALGFSGAASNDPDGDPLTYAWDFGDGSTATGVAPSHAYAATGTFAVTLTVNDGTSTSVPATSTVTIANRAPNANIGGPYAPSFRNAVRTFDGTQSGDLDGDTITYSWNFGDGATGTGASPTHAYTLPGTFTVTLIVNDGTLDSAPSTATIEVQNRTPSIDLGGTTRNEWRHLAFAMSATAGDLDNDPVTVSWDFGDGTTATGTTITHTYAAIGTYTMTVKSNDGLVDSTPATMTVIVSNRAPQANAGGPYSGVRTDSISFSGSGSSDLEGDPLTYSWNFGDGGTATGIAPAHVYMTAGAFTVTLTVNDGTLNSSPATATVTVASHPPVAHPGGPYSGTKLAPISFNGSGSTDPDGDPLTYLWDFGDSTTGTGVTPTHTYAAAGTYSVLLRVNDGTLNSAPVATTVQINNVAPTITITAPASGSVFSIPANVGVTANASDPDGTIVNVQFYVGASPLGQDASAPYTATWNGLAPGTYVLTAVATDSNGATTTSAPVTVTLNQPPTISLTSPAPNAQYAAPATIALSANATDADGTIAQVQFFRGSTSLGIDSTSPYSVTWSGAAAGSYVVTAVATDNRGAVVTSTPITVKVTATLAPTADSYVRASNGNSNFGTDTTFLVQQGTSNGNIRWTYLKFDLSSVPTITNAKVRVFGAVSATTSTAIQTAVYSVSNTTWTETGLTWNNKPSTGATQLSSATIVNNSTTTRWYELDVTAYLQAEKAAGRNVVTLALKNLASSTPYVSFTSREGSVANRPQVLVVP